MNLIDDWLQNLHYILEIHTNEPTKKKQQALKYTSKYSMNLRHPIWVLSSFKLCVFNDHDSNIFQMSTYIYIAFA